jgi:hypothetical protein
MGIIHGKSSKAASVHFRVTEAMFGIHSAADDSAKLPLEHQKFCFRGG